MRERSSIRAVLSAEVDVLLHGHLHETDLARVASPHGDLVELAAGAAYQTRRWPNCALYEHAGLTVRPIRYEDTPIETWTVDPTVFPARRRPRRSDRAARRRAAGRRATWFEQAAAEARQGDVHGCVAAGTLATILRSVARCLRALGDAAAARRLDDEAGGLGDAAAG